MTGCDLRYMAEEMIQQFLRTGMDTRSELVAVAVEIEDVVNKPVAELVVELGRLATRVRAIADTHRNTEADNRRHGFETIEKVREHFHEAVDQRVESDISEREPQGITEEAADERVNDACSELKDEIEEAVVRAIRNCA